MGKLLSLLSRDDSNCCTKNKYDVFLDFENAQPTEAEHELFEEVQAVLQDSESILDEIQFYKGAGKEIREAIATPTPECQTKAWTTVVPLVLKLRRFYLFSTQLEEIVPKILLHLCSGPEPIAQHLDTQQALVKQFAEILEFVLKFDEHKMKTPAIQNDFSYYRRSLQKQRMFELESEREREDREVPDDRPSQEVNIMQSEREREDKTKSRGKYNNEETRNNSGEQLNVIDNNEETRNDGEEPLKVIHNNNDESRNGNEEQLLMAIEDNVEFKINRYEQTSSKDLLNYELDPESSERLYNMKDSQNSVTAIIQDNECEVKTTIDLSDRLTESNKRDYNFKPESFGPESSKTDKDKLDISEPSTVNTQPNQVDMDSREQRTCTESSENHITKDLKSSPTCKTSQGKILTNHDQKKHVFRDLTRESKRTSPERKETKRNPKLSKYKDFIAGQIEKRKFMRKGISKADAEIISSQTDFSYGLRERKVKDLALQENRRLSLRINSNLKRKNTDEVQSSNEKKRKSMSTKINKNVHAIASEAPVGPTSESLYKNHEEKSNEAVKECTSDSNLCTVITNGDTIFIQLKSQSENIAIYDAMQSDCYVVIDNDHLMNETPLVIFDEAGEQIRIESNTELGTHITEPHVEPNKETPPTLKPFYEIKNIHENVKSIPILKPEHLVESDENQPNAETQSKSMLIKAKKADTKNVHDSTRSDKKNNKSLASPHPSSDIKKPRLKKKSSSCKTSPELSQHIQQENQGSHHKTCENSFSVDMDCKENLLITERHETVPENTSSEIKEKTVSIKETSKCTQRIKNKRKLLKSFDEDENMNKISRTDEKTKPDINATEKILNNLENEKKKATKEESNHNENKSTTKAKRKYFETDTNELKSTNHSKDSNPSQIKSKTHELPPNKFVCPKKQEKENKSERSKEATLNQKRQEVANDKKVNSKDNSDKQPIGVKNSKTPPEKNIDSKKTSNPKSSLKKRLNAFDANLSLFKSDDRDLKSIKKIIKKTGNKIEKPPETEVKKSETSDSSLDLKIKSNTYEESKENTTNTKLDENTTNTKGDCFIYTTTNEKDAEELLEKMVSATLIPLPTAKNSLCITEKSKCSDDNNTPLPLRLSEKEDHSKYEQVIENNQKIENYSNVSNDIELKTKRPMDAIEKQDEAPDVFADTSESHIQNDKTQGNNVLTEDGNSVTKTNFNNNKSSTSDLHNASLEIKLKTNSQTCNKSLSEETTDTTIPVDRSCSSEPKIEDPFAILIKEVNDELKNAYNYSKQVVGFDSPLHHNVRNLLFNKRNNMDGSPKPYYDEVRCAQEIENILLSESRSLSPFSERMLKANNENPFGIENPEEYFHHDIDYSRKTRHWQVRDTSPNKHTPSPPIILGENRLLSINSPIGQQNLTPPMLIRPNILLDDLEIPNDSPDIEERCKPSTSTTEKSFVPTLDLPNKEKWVAEPELSAGINHSFDVSTEIEQNQLSGRIELPSFSEIALKLSGNESFSFGIEKRVEAESITEIEKVSAPEFETESTECVKKDEVEDTVVDERHTEVQDEHLTEHLSESSTQGEMIQASIHDTPFIDETQGNDTADTTLGDLCNNQENIALNKQLTIDEGFTQTICEKDGAPTSAEGAQTLFENPLVTSDCEISNRLNTLKLVELTESNSSCGVPDYLVQDKEIVDQDIQSDEELSVVESNVLEKENDNKTNSEVSPDIDEAKEFKVPEETPDINETIEISNSQKTTEEDEMLISSIMDWPYLEEEVVTQNDEDKTNAFEDVTDLRIKLPWSKIFDLKDGCDSESVDSQQGSLELGPVEIKLQLNSFQTSCLKVKRLILQKAHSESSDRDMYEDIKTNQPSVALSKEDLIEEMLNNQVYCIKLQDIVSCDFCGKQLLSQDFLSRHLRHLHELHSCPACDEQFSGELSLLAHTVCHKQRHHCLLCNKVFSSDEKFKQHENSGSHRQLESVQRQTIHILYKYLSGRDCTSLEPLSAKEVTQLRWYPSETRDDTINYYHPTPLHQVLQSIDNDTPSPSPCSCGNADCDGNTCNEDC
uniref:Protein FAM49A n=1 Tax=Cacopsylla melanoneura TaxID=428564 RepID=A0A8D8XXJ7_9HEMI